MHQLADAAEQVEARAADVVWKPKRGKPDRILKSIEEIVVAKNSVDDALQRVLDLRTQFVNESPDDERREHVRHYLRIAAQLIDLSGRLRYLLRDAIDNATYDLSPYPDHVDRLIATLTKHRVGIGAIVMSYALFDPPPDSGVAPFGDEDKRNVLELFAATRDIELTPFLADFVRQDGVSPPLVVRAAEVIREIGLPQDPRPGTPHPSRPPAPVITAAELRDVLIKLDAHGLDDELLQRRMDLLSWLDERIAHGVVGDTFRVGTFDVRAGDWMLMKNPSPYNSFTDLSPGLFTHVGIVAVEEDKNGFRRFVIVDLLERGERVPAVNVDAYVRENTNWFFVRHRDAEICQQMGQAAADLIGNEFHFDLNFRTDRVLALKGKPLKGQVIYTYCAGILLLCAQQTDLPRDEFFPIPENAAGGHCPDNLKKLGLSIGEDFVSPTGALFSPNMLIAGRREPMYSPGLEVKEAVYDYFAESMVNRKLTPSPDAYQALREKLATLSKYNPWLAQALAKANNVSHRMDLEAAAKTAAVLEALNDIAEDQRIAFREARPAIVRPESIEQLTEQGLEAESIQRIEEYRARHQGLLVRWQARQLTPRELRIELVNYYKQQGQAELNNRFFREE